VWLRTGNNASTGRGLHLYGALRHLTSPSIVLEDESAELRPEDRFMLDNTGGVTGVVAGIRLRTDTRDAHRRTTRGVLLDLQVERFRGVGGTTEQYVRAAASAYGYVPLGRSATVALRAIAVVTGAGNEEPVSYLLLPALDNRYIAGTSRERLVDSDLLAFTAEVRGPTVALPLVRYDFQPVAQASLGQVYSGLGRQFSLAVGSDVDDRRLPLRPFGGVGARIYPRGDDALFLSGYLGTGTATLSIGKVMFENDTRREREPWR
jgi:hypothetical protein